MNRLAYRIRFHTPAFLGNAEQVGQWRTPPIKALLRQWWRVAYAAGRQGEPGLVATMRADEGQLFGAAADGGDSCRSLLRLRLDQWTEGRLKSWQGIEQPSVRHDDVEQTGFQVGPHAYLGFGPLDARGGTKLAGKRTAIAAGDFTVLRMALDGQRNAGLAEREAPRLATALVLMNHYGTLGGRSRNGWGSFSLAPADDATPAIDATLDPSLVRPWRDALTLDWPHAIGRDTSGPLIWQTDACQDWKTLMRRLAEIKIGLRTQFKFTTGKTQRPEPRHWLSYPVTNHSVSSWGNARLPNSLRFKVRPGADGKLHGVIVHLPCLPPDTETARFRPDRATIEDVWQRVHAFLDQQPATTLTRTSV